MKYLKIMFIISFLILLSGCTETFTVTFNTNGGNNIASSEALENMVLQTPEKEGYVFLGWFYDEECTEEYDKDKEVTSDFTLYAKWDTSKVTIKFITNSSDSFDDVIINYEDSITNEYVPTKDGHSFLGWYYDEEFKNEYKQDDKIYQDICLYAKWQINKYNVTFKDYDGTVLDSTVVFYQRQATTKVVPQREGYEFIGWSEEINSIEEDLEVFAVYEQITFEVKFNLTIGGYQIIDLNSRTVPYGESYSFKISIYTGYTPSWKIQPFIEDGLDRILIEPENDIYTVSDIKEDILIYVQSRGESNVEDIVITGAKNMTVGETIKLDFEIIAATPTSQVGTWSSSDPNIATVDEEGNVTAHSKGEVTIYILAFDMKFRKSVVIVVE